MKNIPNALTILRLFITVFFVIAVDKGEYRVALYLFVIQGLTDLLDGFLARALGSKTRLGAFLDPIADKAMLIAAYVALSVKTIVPLWLTSIILLRDAMLVIGFIVLYRLAVQERPAPSIWGKLTTTFQIFTIVYVLFSETRDLDDYFFWTTAFFTAVSGCHYLFRGFRLLPGTRKTI